MSAVPDPDANGRLRDDRTTVTAVSERIERLEGRLVRERAARREAEQIAEDGMRALWESNRELEQRVAERTTELERSLGDARVAAAAKERFLADLGHDLATPLHNVLGLLELVDTAPLHSSDRNRVADAIAHADRLADLLQGLVDLAGADSPVDADDVDELDISEWLDDVVDTWTRPAARRAQLLVPSVHGESATARSDWARLRRVVPALTA